MTINRLCMLLVATILSSPATTRGDNLFFDDFESRLSAEDRPLTWELSRFGAGDFDAVGGRLVAMPTQRLMLITGVDELREDLSIRTLVRRFDPSEESPQFIRIYVRANESNGTAYYGGIHDDGSVFIRRTGSVFLADAETELDPLANDTLIQLDVIDETLSLWAWLPGEPMPAEPLLTTDDDSLIGAGRFALSFGSVTSDLSDRTVEFEFVRIDDTHILSGDYNGDGALNVLDIDLQSEAMRDVDVSIDRFDEDFDDAVNMNDRTLLIDREFGTWMGDTNLDGEFNSSDLVASFTAGQYEDAVENNSTWSTGDWNGDSEFDSSDFVLAFSSGGYEQGPRASSPAVPEPATSTLHFALICVSGYARMATRRCRR